MNGTVTLPWWRRLVGASPSAEPVAAELAAATGDGGNGSATRQPPGPGTIIKSQVVERWVQQVTKGLTPEVLNSHIEAAIAGEITNLFAFYEEMEEKWTTLRGALFKHRAKVSQRRWRIVPPDKPLDPALAKAKADLAGAAFAGIEDFLLTRFDLLDALGKGVSVAEVEWGVAELAGRAAVVIKRMPWVNYRHLGYIYDSPDMVLYPDLARRSNPIPIPPRKFVVFQHRTKSGHAARAGLCRPLGWLFLVYLYAVNDWATLAETYGIDVAHAFCPKDATPEQRQKILLHLSRMAARAGVFDVGTVIELERAAAGGTAPQEGLTKYLEAKALELIMGGTLPTTAPEKGTFALGDVQQREGDELMDWSALLLAGALTNGPLRWLMEFNFAGRGDDPKLELPGAKRRDLTALANVLNILVGLGARVPERWVHEEFDIPYARQDASRSETDGEELVLERAAVPAPAFGVPGPLTAADRRPVVAAVSLAGEAAQRALDVIRDRAIAQGRDIGAFEQVVGPLRELLARSKSPADALRELDAVAKEIEPTKLAGVLEELQILGDLIGRAVVEEETGAGPNGLSRVAGSDAPRAGRSGS